MSLDQEAEVLLQVPRANIDEIIQAQGAPRSVGQRRTVVQGVELLVLSLTFTQEQLAQVAATLGVGADHVAARAGEPVVVLLCGEYRVPLLPNAPARCGGPLNYVFYLPELPIGINLDPTTSPEIVEAFEFIVKTYGTLEQGGIPTLGATVPYDAQHPSAPHHMAPAGLEKELPSSAYASSGEDKGAMPMPAGVAVAAGTAGMYEYRPRQPGPTGPAPEYAHMSLEEQQKAALAAARGEAEYVMPRHLPGSGTLIMQTAPDHQPVRTSTRIAHGIGEFARRATNILTSGSDVAGRGIRQGAQHVVDNTTVTESPVHVPEMARNRLRQGRMATRGAVHVSGAFASAVVGVSTFVSDRVSSRLRNHVPPPNEQRSGVDDMKEVGIAAVGAACLVSDAAMDAVRTLLTATSESTTQIVTHKLGSEAGELTQDGLGLVTDSVAAASNMRKAGLKSVAAATLKDTARKTVG
jgi:hypothetical protein